LPVPEPTNKPLPRGELVKLRPALLRDRDAAEYLARSASWIRRKRADDVKAKREGRDATGPKWITIGASVFYRLQDLDEWIATNAVPRGVVAFSNRGGGVETT
jgi:predicted DNA-binding transcriptional regulator AlpA